MATPELALIPTGYKAGKVYSVLPETGVGDFDFTRASAATRINSAGLLEVVQYSIGGELVTNGDFATDSDWAKGTGWTISGGKANANTTGNYVNLTQNNIFEVGKTYKVTFTITAYTQGSIRLTQAGLDISGSKSGLGTYTTTYKAVSVGSEHQLIMQGLSSFVGSIDNVSAIEWAINDVPRLEYPLIDGVVNGCPSLLLENQATNLITYPISFGNSYWTKSGASIEGDPSTAGSELVTNGDFTTDTVWTKGTGWTIGSGVASSDGTQAGTSALYQDCGIVLGKQYQVVYDVTSYTAGSVRIYLGGTSTGAVSRSATGTYTQQFSALGNQWVTIEADASFIGSIDNVSVKEVQGYSSPSVDFPTSAFKLVEDTGSSRDWLYTAISGTNTGSIYAKYIDIQYLAMLTQSGQWNFFDIKNGVLGTINSSDSVCRITELANGWYRLTMEKTHASFFNIAMSKDGITTTYTGDGTSGVYLFMAQLEQGSYATSPTLTSLSAEGTTTTRVAEVCNGAGDASTFNDSEGVLMVDISGLVDTDNYRMISLNAGDSSNTLFVGLRNDTGNVYFYLINGGITQANYISNVNATNSNVKLAVKYKANDVSFYVNGFELYTDTSATMITGLNELEFNYGNASESYPFYGKTKQIQYFNTVLTSAELETLTSWTSFISMANALNYNII